MEDRVRRIGQAEARECVVSATSSSVLALDCDLETRRALDDVVDDPDLARDDLVGVAYLLPVIIQCVEDAFALEVLNSTAAEQPDSVKRTAAYHVDWARRITKALQGHQPTAGPITLGDLVLPVKMSVNWPLVVVDAPYNKTGVVDLDTRRAQVLRRWLPGKASRAANNALKLGCGCGAVSHSTGDRSSR